MLDNTDKERAKGAEEVRFQWCGATLKDKGSPQTLVSPFNTPAIYYKEYDERCNF